MACKVRWKCLFSVFIYFFSTYRIHLVNGVSLGDNSPSKDFSRYVITKPKIYHGRDKQILSSTRDTSALAAHQNHILISITLGGKPRLLDLTLNHQLIPKSYFEKSQRNGSSHVQSLDEHVELCHYNGKVQDVPDSWAAVSTCQGLRGVVSLGDEMYYLETNPNATETIVYHSQHLTTNHTCGYPDASNHYTNTNRIHRFKREVETIRGPYNANENSRYVELVLVVDHKEYIALGEKLPAVYQHCKDIANIINSLFMPLNIFIALVGVVVWSENDEIELSANGDTTLTNFLHYRRERLVKDHPNDNAQLLTRTQFDGGVVGKALKGPICTYEFSGGVNMDHSSVVGLVATTVAHELGHNFGMEHDTSDCNCKDDRCIMAPSSSSTSPSAWSDCSLEYLAHAFEHGMDYCLRNKPTKLFESPVCGNGFVEPGEQCDCGLPHSCTNTCCNATSCMLYPNASCATGQCCDLQTCRPKTPGTVCRRADHECDLPEFCTGESEYCPGDVFKMDGETCNKGTAFCYQGTCRTHSDQCKLLWGPSGKSSDLQCYEMNTKGSRNGNCGYNRVNQTYIKCVKQNVFCGMVHCRHLNERLEFGMESVSILSHAFINNGGAIIPCRTAIVDLGLNEVDPGLAPDGAKCGDGRMCVNQKCMAVGDLRQQSTLTCPQNCNDNGVCNSKGHCHCSRGFAPPLCDYPGNGGSLDSGPATDPNLHKEVVTGLYVVFLGIVPVLAIAALILYYTRHNVKIWWKKSPAARNNISWEHKRQSPIAKARNQDNGHITIQTSESSGHLLSPSEATTMAGPPANGPPLHSDLLGHFKGFTIMPIKKDNSFTSDFSNNITSPETNTAHTSSIMQPASEKKIDNLQKNNLISSASNGVKFKPRNNENINLNDPKLRPISPPILPVVNFKNSNKPKSVHFGPKVHTAYVSDEIVTTVKEIDRGKPKISEPVLEASTCTVKEIVETAGLVPVRKAPEAPCAEKYSKPPPPVPKQRPLSSPVLDSEEDTLLKELKDTKEYPTLTRLASLMRNASISRSQNLDKKKIDKVEPRRKINRDKLKNIEISNPIPVVDEVDNPQVSVTRAHSMRETAPNPKQAIIQTFGSMRVTKRPTSIHVPHRPTSPPPPRPEPKSENKADYSYDDCLNLLSEKMAPLADVDEESPSSPDTVDNIYAVIEESPSPKKKFEPQKKSVHFEEKYDTPKSLTTSPEKQLEYKSPKLLDSNSKSGSTESMGLLGEIVSEIQSRNLDSIYSTGTLKRNQKKAREAAENYENVSKNVYHPSDTSTTSSGYLNPNRINAPPLGTKGAVNNVPTSASSSNAYKNKSIFFDRPIPSIPTKPVPSLIANSVKNSSTSTTPSTFSNNSGKNVPGLLSSSGKNASGVLSANSENIMPKSGTGKTAMTNPSLSTSLTTNTSSSGLSHKTSNVATELETSPPLNPGINAIHSSLTPEVSSPSASKLDTNKKLEFLNEGKPEPKVIDLSNYKPYTPSFTRPSGPLASSFSKKFNPETKPSDVVSQNSVSVSISSPLSVNQTIPSSASPYVRSSFNKPGLLSTPTPPKLTPQSITSSFKTSPQTTTITTNEDEATPKNNATKTPNLPTTESLQRTLSSGKGGVTPVSKPTVIRAASIPPKEEKISRPLPSPPRKSEPKTVKTEVHAPTKPLPPIPKKDSKENLSKIKKPNDIKTETKSGLPKRTSNVSSLQNKFENKTIGPKPTPPNPASKPKTSPPKT